METIENEVFNFEERRKAMFAGELSHFDFYLEFGNAIGKEALLALIPAGTEFSKDEYLNDIALSYWDYGASKVPALIAQSRSRKQVIINRGTSLSERVCLLKTMAQAYVVSKAN